MTVTTEMALLPDPATPACPQSWAPALAGRRVALGVLSAPPALPRTLPQATAVGATVAIAAIAGMTGGADWIGGTIAAAGAGVLLGLGALRTGLALGLRPRGRVVGPLVAALGGLGLLLALGIGWPGVLAVLASATVAGGLGLRQRRDLLTEHLLRWELEQRRADLAREDAAFCARLRTMRDETEAEIRALCRQAGLDPARLDGAPGDAM